MNMLIANTINPTLGVILFLLGGLAAAIFYMPFKKVTKWAWESYWLVYAMFGLFIVPWIMTFMMSPNVMKVLHVAPRQELWYCFLCGAVWGVGGLTWGLMIRYLGVGLGLAMGCGLCSVAGTLIPPLLKGQDARAAMFTTPAGIVSVIAVCVSVVGIVFVGLAGRSKEKDLSEEEKKKTVAEFNFKKGLIAVLFSGLMSSAMSFGLQGGAKIEELALQTVPVTSVAWKGMPVLIVVFMGGFLVNFIWCILLNLKNKTADDYIGPEGAVLLANIVFAGLAGTIWSFQHICFKAGAPRMGNTSYIGWGVLMASAILFSTILGVMIGEWKGTSKKTASLLTVGLLLLILSVAVAGYSGYLGQLQLEQVPTVATTSVPSAS